VTKSFVVSSSSVSNSANPLQNKPKVAANTKKRPNLLRNRIDNEAPFLASLTTKARFTTTVLRAILFVNRNLRANRFYQRRLNADELAASRAGRFGRRQAHVANRCKPRRN